MHHVVLHVVVMELKRLLVMDALVRVLVNLCQVVLIVHNNVCNHAAVTVPALTSVIHVPIVAAAALGTALETV